MVSQRLQLVFMKGSSNYLYCSFAYCVLYMYKKVSVVPRFLYIRPQHDNNTKERLGDLIHCTQLINTLEIILGSDI